MIDMPIVNNLSYDKKTGRFNISRNKAMQELARNRLLRKIKSDLEIAVSQSSLRSVMRT